jgi:translation initiation factor 1A
MPPNKIGGKNYKKSKSYNDDPVIYDRLPGQMYGRVTKLVGGGNVMVYCNDNCERLCHIRGNMRKKVWIAIGDIVLISLRDLDVKGHTVSNNIQRGDICAKYDQRIIYKLKEKDKTINDKLFTIVDKSDKPDKNLSSIPVGDNECGYVFEEADNNTDTEDNTSENELLSGNRLEQRKEMMAGDNDGDNDSEVDIDNI